MSDATYSIEIRTDPHSTTWPYRAFITRLSDNDLRQIIPATTQEGGVLLARQWIANEDNAVTCFTRYVGDDGQDAEVPL